MPLLGKTSPASRAGFPASVLLVFVSALLFSYELVENETARSSTSVHRSLNVFTPLKSDTLCIKMALNGRLPLQRKSLSILIIK